MDTQLNKQNSSSMDFQNYMNNLGESNSKSFNEGNISTTKLDSENKELIIEEEIQ